MVVIIFMMDFAEVNKSLTAIGKKLEENLDNWEAWSAKADILFSLGLYDVSIRCCDRSLVLNPDNALTWITKGNAFDKLGMHEDADVAFAKAKELGYKG